jgi:aconitate hydratase
MKLGVAGRIIEKHLVEGTLSPGREITVKIDQTLTQDATGTMAALEFEAIGADRIKTELSVSYVDHNTVQAGFENADDHIYLQSFAAKYGLLFSRAGNGICHQVHLERFAMPGKTLLGADSHTPTAGGMGMIAIGAGGLDIAVAMARGTFSFICPKVTNIRLTGKLKPWVSSKDVILEILRIMTTKGNVGTMLEYGGPGALNLSVPERATMTNMGAELGVTTSVFPSDRVTLEFLKSQGRQKEWKEITADDNAQYARVIELDLDKIEPMIALPHAPDNVSKVKDVAGKKVQQVGLGSCTNSSYRDLMLAAKILGGKKIHPDVSLIVAPGSRQVLKAIADNGGLSELIAAGARITECACGFCIGNSFAPPTNGVSIRTINRNFKGRSGTKDAQVYLASTETAAASALKGAITDPRSLGAKKYPSIKPMKKFTPDDTMIIKPPKDGSKVEVQRGPNIGAPPKTEPLKDDISGTVTIKVADDITTDHIMPAGQRLRYRSNIQKYSEFVFEPLDAAFPARCLENKSWGKDNVIVAGLGYGQGSSREHAAICPAYLGVKAVIAKSIERIHAANLVNFGIVPLVFADAGDYAKLEQDDEIEIPDIKEIIEKGGKLVLRNKTRDLSIELKYDLTGRQKEILIAGGLLNYIR